MSNPGDDTAFGRAWSQVGGPAAHRAAMKAAEIADRTETAADDAAWRAAVDAWVAKHQAASDIADAADGRLTMSYQIRSYPHPDLYVEGGRFPTLTQAHADYLAACERAGRTNPYPARAYDEDGRVVDTFREASY